MLEQMYNFYPEKLVQPPGCAPNILLVMKLTTLFMIAFILQVSAKSYAQKITLNEKNSSLNAVFEKISNQTGYDFLVSTENLKKANAVTVNVENEELRQTLNKVFYNQPLTYAIQDKIVVVTAKEKSTGAKADGSKKNPLSGKILDDSGNPLPGATVRLNHSELLAVTNSEGIYTFSEVPDAGLITVNFIGFEPVSLAYDSSHLIPKVISLKAATGKLDAVQIIGYGQTTKRFNTGSITGITSKDIIEQPVTNVLGALSGRAPGVFVQTTNGLPGGNINIQIRGKGSIAAGTVPLYVIDGVPFEGSSSTAISQFSIKAVNGVVSPLNSINPNDIEDITILKDADATSIYGSRGSNGVVLITTKKGKTGADRVNIRISQGISSSTTLPAMLGTNDYLALRKEAFANDKLTPTAATAPDLLLWSQTEESNWPNYLFGHTSSATDIQASVSGGQSTNSYSVSANMHQEGNVISKDANYLRGGIRLNLEHHYKNFGLTFTTGLELDDNHSPNLDNVSKGILLPPNFPLTDATGLNTVSSGNPLIDLNARTRNRVNNLMSSLVLSYALQNGFTLKLSSGYNRYGIDQERLFPLSSVSSGTNYSQFQNNNRQSVIAEPQLNYSHGNLTVLLGGTYQNQFTNGQFLQVSNFSNEGLMENFASAASVDNRSNIDLDYKYISVFGRINYNLRNKWILNFTARRDGSSRFGPDNRFGNFWAAGGAWIFSEENWLKNHIPVMSFGKLRASYGVTGNDQIPDYQYLSTYQSSGRTYQGVATLAPSRISNSDFHWETTAKIDFGLELGFFSNRLSVDIDAYQNRSKDQLVNYTLPASTGFTTYLANLPAVVENSGLELSLNTVNIKKAEFSWKTAVNLTVPRNKLISFDNLAGSGYAQTYVIGYDITRVKGYQFLGVDPQTGSATYADVNGNIAPTVSSATNNATLGKTTPAFYGGFGNTFIYKRLSLSIFFQGARQHLPGGISYSAGQRINSYAYALERWKQPGDITNVPKASTISDPNYILSSANFFDASYIRLKNIDLSYRFQKLTFSMQGENLLTLWHHGPLVDPEAGALIAASPAIAPLRTFTAAINLNF